MRFKNYKIIAVPFIIFCAISTFLIHKSYVHYFHSSQEHAPFIADLSDISDSSLSHYYVHTNGTLVHAIESGVSSRVLLDSANIPIVDYGDETGQQYNPVTIAQFGLESFELYLQTKDKKYYHSFLDVANWLSNNQFEGRWLYNFEIEDRNLKKGWISAMAQGQAISLLLRAWQVSQDSIYLNVASNAFEFFKINNLVEGVAYPVDDVTWYEEYPNPQKPSHVLNGHIYALFGLWDYYRVIKDETALELFEKGKNAVIKDIKSYDTGYWVLYQQNSLYLLNGTYMDLHIDQMNILYNLTGDSIFQEYENRWQKYYNNFWILPVLVFVRVFL